MTKKIFNITPKIKTLIILFFICLLGFLLRLWRIDQAPKGALIDELHFGYLAQSLIKTGTDEHGQSWPIIFKGFGDEKLPAMAYLDIPSVAVFGLSVKAIRIPSVLAGTFLILSVYWLALELKLDKKWALLAAFFTAISPWSFFLSRFGFESNLALLFLTIGICSLLKAHSDKKNNWYILSAIAMALTWYSYIPYRPISVGIILLFSSLHILNKSINKKISIFFIAFLIAILPLFAPSVIGVNSTRFDQVGILSEPGVAELINEKRTFCISSGFSKLICYSAYNKPVHLFRKLSNRYLMSFSPDFLVSVGEINTDFLTIDRFGQFFPILYPFFLIGLGGLFFSKDIISTVNKRLIIGGLLITPIPSALVGEPQKVRISALYIFVLITIVFGVYLVEKALSKKIFKHLFLAFIVVTCLAYTFLYQVEYHGVHAKQNEYKYQSYLPELFEFAQSLSKNTLVNIYPFFSDPLMFYAFYTKMDPAIYQKLAVVDEPDGANFQHTVELGNVHAYKASIEEIGCEGIKGNYPAVFISNKYINDAPILYRGKASNGVHTYVFAYDATEHMKYRKCSNDQD